jgi:hypothetical protein
MLSHEKTPTLSNAIPAFEAMIQTWQVQQEKYPELYDVIQVGIDKLEAYHERAELVPAYVLAMGMYVVRSACFFINIAI